MVVAGVDEDEDDVEVGMDMDIIIMMITDKVWFGLRWLQCLFWLDRSSSTKKKQPNKDIVVSHVGTRNKRSHAHTERD